MTTVVDDPFEHGITGELVAKLSSPIGYVTLNWSFIEQYMAAIIEISSDAVSVAGIKVRRPRQFGEKLAVLRDVFEHIPALKAFKQSADVIFDCLDRLTPIRHALSHGTMSQFDSETGIIVFNKVNPDPSRSYHEIEEVSISVENIERAADISERLAHDLGKLASEIMDSIERTR